MGSMAHKTQTAPKAKKVKACRHCSRPAKTRGLCNACYVAALRDFESGKITEDKAIKIGLIGPGRGAEREAASAWSKAVDAALAET
jgi:hypothetical protein